MHWECVRLPNPGVKQDNDVPLSVRIGDDDYGPNLAAESDEIIFKMQGQSNVITDQISCIHIFIQKKL